MHLGITSSFKKLIKSYEKEEGKKKSAMSSWVLFWTFVIRHQLTESS